MFGSPSSACFIFSCSCPADFDADTPFAESRFCLACKFGKAIYWFLEFGECRLDEILQHLGVMTDIKAESSFAWRLTYSCPSREHSIAMTSAILFSLLAFSATGVFAAEKRGLAYNNNNPNGDATYANLFKDYPKISWGYDWGYPAWGLDPSLEL